MTEPPDLLSSQGPRAHPSTHQLACISLTALASVLPLQASERKASLGGTQEAHWPHIPSEAMWRERENSSRKRISGN